MLTERSEIRSQRPDILITNYKMLDLLLQRGEDLTLWQDADIGYVVVDEFHTYDGAQGTDVAMLLRGLAAATNHSQPGKPLGDICPVATSATLGEGGDEERIREVAEQVFGTAFGENSVITEQRLPAGRFLGEIDYSFRSRRRRNSRGWATRGWTTRRWGTSPNSSPARRSLTRRGWDWAADPHPLARAYGRPRRQAVHIQRGAGPAAPEGCLHLG